MAIVVLAGALIVWAGTRPGFDPYGWLVWGYQALHLSLDLGGAPSWKPLPFLFTVPYALFGHYSVGLWMLTSVSIALAGPVFAGRIAYRLIDAGPEQRHAALAGAVFAGLSVLGIQDYMHYILSAQSDPVIVTLCLAAIDAHLAEKPHWAFGLGVLAALGRPEVWPFLALYSLWGWRALPRLRWVLIGGWALIAFLWFGIPTITNGRPFVAGQLALNSPRELHQGKVIGTINRFTGLQYLPIWIAVLLTVVAAVARRERVVLALAGGCVGWVIVEIAFALHGWPALPRYVMEPAAVAGTIAGVGVGWALLDASLLVRGAPRWLGAAAVAVIVVALVPGAIARLRTERRDLTHERGRTHEISLMNAAISALGGVQHIRRCGRPVTEVEFASAMALTMRVNVGFVGYQPQREARRRHPIVWFEPVPAGGWTVLPRHTRRELRAACRGLRADYVLAAGHAGGVLIRR